MDANSKSSPRNRWRLTNIAGVVVILGSGLGIAANAVAAGNMGAAGGNGASNGATSPGAGGE